MDEQNLNELELTLLENDKLILSTIDKFLEKDVKPYVKEFESEDKYPQKIADKMADLGLFGATISEKYGGRSACRMLKEKDEKDAEVVSTECTTES